jgi:hypothetical protein
MLHQHRIKHQHFFADECLRYLSVLISIILTGHDAVLGGVGGVLQARPRRRIYWVHAIWIVNLFLYSWSLADFLPLAQPAAMDVFSSSSS